VKTSVAGLKLNILPLVVAVNQIIPPLSTCTSVGPLFAPGIEYSTNLCSDMTNLPNLLAEFSANQSMLESVAIMFANPALAVGTLKTVKKFGIVRPSITIWLLPVELMAMRLLSTHVIPGWKGDEVGAGVPLAKGRTNSLI